MSAILFYSRRGSTEPAVPRPDLDIQIEGSGTPSPTPPTTMMRQLGGVLGDGNEPARKQPRLEFVESESEMLPGQGVRLYGSVRNDGDATANRVRIRLTALDAEDKVLDRGVAILVPPRLEPGQLGFYEMFLASPEAPASVEAVINWQRR
jgi:hypothetical protein